MRLSCGHETMTGSGRPPQVTLPKNIFRNFPFLTKIHLCTKNEYSSMYNKDVIFRNFPFLTKIHLCTKNEYSSMYNKDVVTLAVIGRVPPFKTQSPARCC
jgi:hypothetical protein